VSDSAWFSDELEEALEKVSVPTYILDPDGIVRWVNPAASRRIGDIRGRKFTSIVAPEDRRRSQEIFASKVAGGASVTDGQFVVVDAGGNRVAVEVSSVPLVRGERVVGVFGQVTRELREPPPEPDVRLTPRQSEVLGLLERGHSTRQIAEELHLSPETVRIHIRHLLRALGVHSRLEAVALARTQPSGAD
jgi:PAS domain S-box-containing protein